MNWRACTLALSLAVTVAPSARAFEAVAAVSGGRCPEGHPETGDLGIRSLLCVSGSCLVNQQTSRGYVHEFSTEPRIRGIVDGSPADGKLQDGDVIIAIDGALITTREGGRRLANLTPGQPVTLRIRRGEKEVDVRLVPELGCNMPSLAVLGGATPRPWPASAPLPAPAPWPAEAARPARSAWPASKAVPAAAPDARPRPLAPPFSFGLELECGSCGWSAGPSGGLQWSSPTAPKVLSVASGGPGDRAGLRPGDVLLEVDGHDFTDREAGGAIAKLRPGQRVTLKLRRGGEIRSFDITPRAVEPTQRF